MFPNQLHTCERLTCRTWYGSSCRSNLRDCDAALSSQLLLRLLGGVGVRQVGVEVLVQNLARLLVEVPPLAPRVQEAGAQDHDGLARGLLQLDLDRVELLVDDLHHPLDLLRGDRTGPRLLSEQVHDMRCELLTARVIPGRRDVTQIRFHFCLLFKLLVVDISNLVEFCFVLAVHDRCVGVLLRRWFETRDKI